MRHFPNYRELERIHGISWLDLVDREPGLSELLWQAHRAGSACRRLSDVGRSFAPVRDTLAALVGFAGRHCRHPVLGRPQAYEIAYWKLYDAVAASVSTAGAEVTHRDRGEETRHPPVREGSAAKTAGVMAQVWAWVCYWRAGWERV